MNTVGLDCLAMKIQNIKRRLEIINEKIERIEELENFMQVAKTSEYYALFGNESEYKRDINEYKMEIKHLEYSIYSEIELLNTLK